jgi:ferric-dicitrate binding protein FerR (iron transport regulator)
MTKKSINSQVRDYLLGRLSEAEQLELEQQLSQHPEWIQEMRQMEDADFTQLYETYEKFGSDEVLQQLKLKVLENKQSQETDHPTVHRHMSQWWRYAAAVLLLAVAGVGYWWYSDYTKVTPPVISQEVKLAMEQSKQSGHDAAVIDNVNVNDNGGKSVKELVEEMQLPEDVVEKLEEAKRITTYHDKEFWLTLPDGTLVHLNYNSRLIYPEKFLGDSRDVILEGDAYFMVAKGRDPFTVHTIQGDVRVYGTEFVVETLDTGGATQVILVKGSVSVTPKGGVETMLPEGHMAVLNEGKSMMNEVDTDSYVAWNTGHFAFRDASLEKVMDVLSRWFGRKVNFKNEELRKVGVIGDFEKMETLDNILRAMSKGTGLHIHQDGQQIIIEK